MLSACHRARDRGVTHEPAQNTSLSSLRRNTPKPPAGRKLVELDNSSDSNRICSTRPHGRHSGGVRSKPQNMLGKKSAVTDGECLTSTSETAHVSIAPDVPGPRKV